VYCPDFALQVKDLTKIVQPTVDIENKNNESKVAQKYA
jgi:hypothetical protein